MLNILDLIYKISILKVTLGCSLTHFCIFFLAIVFWLVYSSFEIRTVVKQQDLAVKAQGQFSLRLAPVHVCHSAELSLSYFSVGICIYLLT